jgi:hypothetical protein
MAITILSPLRIQFCPVYSTLSTLYMFISACVVSFLSQSQESERKLVFYPFREYTKLVWLISTKQTRHSSKETRLKSKVPLIIN